MTYGVERMTFQGRTLHEKLRAQYGERTAKSVSRGLEANKRKEAERRAAGKDAAPAARNAEKPAGTSGRRTVTSVMRTVGAKKASVRAGAGAPSRQGGQTGGARGAMAENMHAGTGAKAGSSSRVNRTAGSSRAAGTSRADIDSRTGAASRQGERHHSAPGQSRYADAQGMYAARNPYRVRVNYFKKPVDGRSDLEVSIATFPRAYRAGMRAKHIMGDGVVRDRSAAHAKVHRGYRSGDVKSERSAYENSVGTMSVAYRRGERMRRVTQIAKAKPTPQSAEESRRSGRFFARVRSVIAGKGSHTAELRLKHSPFPIGTLALMAVCTLVVMVMISSFAQLSEYRAQIADLESRRAELELDRSRLTGLVESREDIRVIEKIATQDIGMVSAELAKGRFVSLADSDRVEVIESEPEEESGVFATILSAISENLGALSEYIN